jgi:hypothetical protein
MREEKKRMNNVVVLESLSVMPIEIKLAKKAAKFNRMPQIFFFKLTWTVVHLDDRPYIYWQNMQRRLNL